MLSNLIIHGVKEMNDDTNSCMKNDEEFISSFRNTLEVNREVSSILSYVHILHF